MVAPPLPPSDDPLIRAKAALRATMLARRKAVPAADAARWSAATAERALDLVRGLSPDLVVAAFWSLPGEIDTAPLREGLLALDRRLALPRLQGRGRPLGFHRWRPGDELLPGPLGLMQPAAEAECLRPDLLFVPLLAFDDAGYRLGYGGGYYDRTLAALAGDGRRRRAIGYAFALQRVGTVPRTALDVRLDGLVTERATRRF
jgi:5-formyltetrahydrofolate cyclo-ligase